jgi:hypothetical protein
MVKLFCSVSQLSPLSRMRISSKAFYIKQSLGFCNKSGFDSSISSKVCNLAGCLQWVAATSGSGQYEQTPLPNSFFATASLSTPFTCKESFHFGKRVLDHTKGETPPMFSNARDFSIKPECCCIHCKSNCIRITIIESFSSSYNCLPENSGWIIMCTYLLNSHNWEVH